MNSPNHGKPLRILITIIVANYLAQIPYYFHQYYAPHRLLPSLVGALLLMATLIWFLAAYRLLAKGHRAGWWLLFAYLLVVFLFYIQTQIMQAVTAHQILLYVYHPKNVLLFAVFGIGYLNCIAALYYLFYLVVNRQKFYS